MLLLGVPVSEAHGGPPTPTHTPAPRYPSWSIGSGISTEVELRVLIDREGRVRRVEVVPYNVRHDLLTRDLRASFDSAAVRAVRTWSFRPATRNGRSVSVWWTLRVPFSDPEDVAASGDSAAWSPDTSAWSSAPQPVAREDPEWPSSVPYECSGVVTVRIFPGRDGHAMAARVARAALRCQDPSLRAAVDEAVIRAALRWRFRAGDHEGDPIQVEFRVPEPRLGSPVLVGCVRDSVTGRLQPEAEIIGAEDGQTFGRTDEHGWFVLRGAATQSSRLRARLGACSGGLRAARPWRQRGDEITLYAGSRRCGAESR
jgi:TonB family protein